MMKPLKKKLAALLCIGALAVMPAAPALAEETAAEETLSAENNDQQTLNANQAMALIQAVASHVSAFGRYENLNERNMYKAGMERLIILIPTIFLYTGFEGLCSITRGCGSSFVPMVLSVFGVCISRLVWIYTVLPIFDKIEIIFYLYYFN